MNYTGMSSSDRVATRLSRRLREARHCKTSRVGPLWGSAAPLRTLRVLRYAAEAVTFFVARATRPCFLRRNHGLVAHAT